MKILKYRYENMITVIKEAFQMNRENNGLFNVAMAFGYII